MKKQIISFFIAAVLVFSLFVVPASAAKKGSIISEISISAIQPIDGNTPITSNDSVKFVFLDSGGVEHDESKFKVKSVSYLSWSDDDSVNFGEFVAGQEYLVSVEITAEDFDVFDHYYYSVPAKEKCKINGVTASAVSLKESDTVLVVSATLRAVKLDTILDFGQVAPGMSAADEARHQTDLGDIEYGEYTMFAYDHYPLSQAQKDMGFTVEEKIYVNQGDGTLATRNSGTPFDLMMYAGQVSSPLGRWSVMFSMNLYQNGVYVSTLAHVYTLNITPAEVSYVSMSVTAPTINTAPDNDLMNVSVHGEGYEVVDIDWTDTEGVIMPDQAVFEIGKIYECVLQVETLGGYVFPESRAEFSGKINGIDGVISTVYSTNKAYVTVQFVMANPGDVNADGGVKSDDALLALQGAVRKVELTDQQFTAADVNSDGNVTSSDALLILQFAVKKITEF